MGYDLHITRKESWADPDGPVLTLDEWLHYVASDKEISRDADNSEHDFLFTRGAFTAPLWWRPDLGEIYTKNPDDLLIEKMVEIAKRLKARVLGDDDEEYPVRIDSIAKIKVEARWVSDVLTEHGFWMDYSPGSLWELDRFLDAHWCGGHPNADASLANEVDVPALAAYVGEVIRRSLDGRWRPDGQQPNPTVTATLVINDSVISPFDLVTKRVQLGTAERIALSVGRLGIDVGPGPKNAQERMRRWWKVW